MQCAENGLVSARLEPSDRPFRFGHRAAVKEAVDALLARLGTLGEFLALGSRRAAERIDGEARAARQESGATGVRSAVAADDGSGAGRENTGGRSPRLRFRLHPRFDSQHRAGRVD